MHHSFIHSFIHSRSSDSQLLLFSSLMFYRVQIREHLTRDQRPFLHPESLQILQIHSFFSSVHSLIFYRVQDQRTPDTRSETIPSSRITPDPSDSQLLLFSSPHSSSTGFRIREHLTRDQRSFLHPESLQILQIHSFFSSVHLTHLLQGSDQRTPDTRSEIIPSSRITPDLQIHSFFSSVHLTHLLQGSDQRTPDPRSETIPSSRIISRSSDSQLLLFSSPHSSSTGFRIREHLTRDQRPFLHPESLQIFRFTASSSSVHLTHLLQGSDQRTPDTRSETIPSSRITPDPSDSQLLPLQFTSLIFYRVQIREHLTRDQRPFLHPEVTPDLQITQLLLFSSPHSSSTGFRSENTWHEIRDPFLHPESLQIFRFTASPLQFTHLLQGSGSENTWHEIRDHSFIQNHSRSSDSQLLLFSSPHSSSTGFRSENTWHEIRDHSFIQNHSRSSDSQLLLFSSLTHLLQGSVQRTPDTRSEIIPSSRITPDLQIHSFFSSVHSLIFYSVQVRGLEWPGEACFCAQWPICVLFLRFMFELL